MGFLAGVFLFALIITSVLITIARLSYDRISLAREFLETEISKQLDIELSLGDISGDWQRFDPVLQVRNVQVRIPNQKNIDSISVGQAELRLNGLSSLRQLKPVFSRISAENWQVIAKLDTTSPSKSAIALDQIVALLSSAKSIDVTRGNVQIAANNTQYKLRNTSLLRTETSARQQLQLRFGFSQEAPGMGSIDSTGRVPADELVRVVFDLKNENQLSGTIFADIPPTSIDLKTVPGLIDEIDSFGFNQATVAGRFWIQIESNEIHNIKSLVYLPELDIQTAVPSATGLSDVALGIQWRALEADVAASAQTSDLMITTLDFNLGDQRWQMEPWNLHISRFGERTLVQADAPNVELEPVAKLVQQLLGSDHVVAKALNRLNLKGVLRAPQVDVELSSGQPAKYNLLTAIEGIDIDPWSGVPGVQHLSGQLAVTNNGGLLSIDSQPFSLHFPQLFEEKWNYLSGSGDIAWAIEEWGLLVSSGLLSLEGQQINANGKLLIQLPKNGQEPQLSLTVGLYDTAVQEKSPYLTNRPEVASLMTWLDQQLVSGKIDAGGVLYQGAISPSAKRNSQNLQLIFDLKETEISFDPSWPSLQRMDATVWLDDDALLIESSQLITEGVWINDTVVKGLSTADGYLLTVSAEIDDSADNLLGYLKSTPIFDLNQELIGQLEITGDLSATLSLEIPFTENSVNVEYELDLALFKNDLALPNFSLEFERAEGGVVFSSRTGIVSKQFTASFLDEPITGLIETSNPNKKLAVTSIQIDGVSTLSSVGRWYDLSQWPLLQGKTDYKAVIDVSYDKSPALLHIYSDLVGVVSDYPAPLNKKVDEEKYFRLSMQLNEGPLHLNIGVDDDINFNLELASDKAPKGLLTLGESVSKHVYLSSITEPGFSVDGILSGFDMGPWVDWVSDSFLGATTSSSEPNSGVYKALDFPLNRMNLKINDLQFDELKFGETQLTVSRNDEAILLEHTSDISSGKAYWFFDEARAFLVNLTELNIDLEKQSAEDDKSLEHLDPASFPAIDFYTKQLTLDGKDTGSWKFELKTDSQGAYISDWFIQSDNLAVNNGSLAWLKTEDESSSRLSLNGSVKDISVAMRSFGIPPGLSSESGIFSVELNTAGSPDQLGAELTTGKVHLYAKNGRFLSGDANGVFGVLNLFNFDGLMRRLTSDFAGLGGESMRYRKIDGGFFLKDDVIWIEDAIKVDGVSANFELSGLYYLKNDQLDMSLVVTLPVNKNLPWYGALVGGLPAAVAVFIAGKLFESSIKVLSSARYRITGSADNPKVELERVFETDTNSKIMKLYEESTNAAEPSEIIPRSGDSNEQQQSAQ